jgi:hypothetical protein
VESVAFLRLSSPESKCYEEFNRDLRGTKKTGQGWDGMRQTKGEIQMGTALAPEPQPTAAKRLNFNVSEKAHAELTALSHNTHRSMTEIIRLGVGLAKIALEAEQKGHRIVIANSNGEPLKEIVIPG